MKKFFMEARQDINETMGVPMWILVGMTRLGQTLLVIGVIMLAMSMATTAMALIAIGGVFLGFIYMALPMGYGWSGM